MGYQLCHKCVKVQHPQLFALARPLVRLVHSYHHRVGNRPVIFTCYRVGNRPVIFTCYRVGNRPVIFTCYQGRIERRESREPSQGVNLRGVLRRRWNNRKYRACLFQFPQAKELLSKLPEIWARNLRNFCLPCRGPKKNIGLKWCQIIGFR
jgi:hypothetical protein